MEMEKEVKSWKNSAQEATAAAAKNLYLDMQFAGGKILFFMITGERFANMQMKAPNAAGAC